MTRFFIPLIDVLTLLFCVYLLMPMVGEPGEAPPEPADVDALRERNRALERKLQDLEARLDPNLKEKLDKEIAQPPAGKALEQRLALRVWISTPRRASYPTTRR